MGANASTLSDRRFTEALIGELRAGRRAALCAVFDKRGSMPRPADARMALFEDGTFVGTVGGGRIELLTQQRCRELLDAALQDDDPAQGYSELGWFTHEVTGMMCGGDVLAAIRLLGPADLSLLEDIASSSVDDGQLVEDWSCAAHPTWHVERIPAGEKRPAAPSWDADAARYIEPLNAVQFVYLYGAGHVAQALAPVLASIGFAVRVFDERPAFLVPELFPDADQLRECRFEELAEDELPAARDFAIITTPSHASDYACLEQALRCNPVYIGCIGSKGKTVRFREWLAEAGFSPEQIDAVHMPIGDSIGAVTPAEIAISIAAEIIRCRSGVRG